MLEPSWNSAGARSEGSQLRRSGALDGLPTALGTKVDLTEPLVRITMDRRFPEEERYYCSGAMYNHICCQVSMGEVTLPVTRVVHRLLAADLVVMWEATFRKLYRHKDMYLRDFDRLRPSECPALFDVLDLLSPKYPEIIDLRSRRRNDSKATSGRSSKPRSRK